MTCMNDDARPDRIDSSRPSRPGSSVVAPSVSLPSRASLSSRVFATEADGCVGAFRAFFGEMCRLGRVFHSDE